MRGWATVAGAALLVGATACQPGREPDTRAAVTAAVRVPGQPAAVTHGDDPLPPRPPALTAQLAPEFSWPCEGTGQEGRRVQFLYVHTAGVGDLNANRETFEGIARRIEGTFLTSARRGGGERLVRFATDGACNLSVLDAVVSPNAVASFDQMIAELAAAGLNRRDRIYHAWVEGSAYCGIGTVYSDDRPTGDNTNEVNAQYSRSDRPCWNYAESHEITHNLGGVQNSAPNSTGGLHSRDEHDVMSYPDGAPNGTMIQPYPCPDIVNEDRLDCGENDYFSAAPVPTGYLATHWNVANAAALTTGSPPTTAPPPPTSTTSTSTSTTSTTVGAGQTKTTLSIPVGLRADHEFTITAKVTGTCRPQGVVAFYAKGKLMSRQVLDGTGTASVRMTFSDPGRFTVRADYEGSSTCATSRATARPRVVA